MRTDMRPEQRAKLPAYARDHINNLERALEETEETLYKTFSVLPRKMYEEGKLADKRHVEGIIVDPNGEHPLAILKAMTVRFWLVPDRFFIDVQIVSGAKRPHLRILGATSLSIQPSSGNLVHLEEGKW